MPARRELCWTFEQEVTLRRMWAEGCSSSEIGNKLGMTRNAVLGKVWRLELPLPEGRAKKTVRAYRKRTNGVTYRPPKPVKPKPVVVKPTSRWLTLAELEATHCRWPEGNQAPFVFCGADIEGDGPYCAAHRKEAFKPERIRP